MSATAIVPYAALTAGATFLTVNKEAKDVSQYIVKAYGTWTGTLTLQTKRPDQAEWHTEKTYTANFSEAHSFKSWLDVRIGFLVAGDFTSGTAEVEIV